MKFSVVMTVYNRPQLMLINTLVKLGQNDWTDGEIVIVDDGSTLPYGPVIDQMAGDLPLRWVRTEPPSGCYSIDGFNNPAAAANYGLDESKGEYIFWMSSDVMLQPHTIDRMLNDLDLSEVVGMPCVVNLDDGNQYLGPDCLKPLGWFYGVHRSHMEAVRWDEEYMKGIAFEDNDFMCRLGLRVGRFVIDQRMTAWHQSHPRIAYSDDLEGWHINERYTQEKWGGMPWHEDCPMVKSITPVNHQIVMDISERKLAEAPAV